MDVKADDLQPFFEWLLIPNEMIAAYSENHVR
jgi:hypothetical protein